MAALYHKDMHKLFNSTKHDGSVIKEYDVEDTDNEETDRDEFFTVESYANLKVACEELKKPLTELDAAYNLLATEGIFTDIKDFFIKRFKDVANLFSFKKDSSLIVDNVILKELIKEKSKVMSIAKELNYSEVSVIKAPTVAGMSVTILKATELLLPITNILENKIILELNNLDTTMSKVLSDDEYCKSNKPIAKVETDYKDQLQDTLSNIITETTNVDVTTIGKLLPNLSCLDTIIENIIRLGNIVDLDKIEEMNKLIKLVYEKTIEVSNIFKNKDRVISKRVLDNLIEQTKVVAEACTLTAAHYNLINQLVNTTRAVIKILENAKK